MKTILMAVFAAWLLSACSIMKDYSVPDSSPTATLKHSIKPKGEPSAWDKGMKSYIFIFNDIDCREIRFARNPMFSNNGIQIEAGKPITLKAVVSYETKDSKMRSYSSGNMITFTPEKDTAYQISTVFNFVPLKTGHNLAFPFTASAEIVNLNKNESESFFPRTQILKEPFGCKVPFRELKESDAVFRTFNG